MTREELIEELQAECRIEKGTAEDFLLALRDLCAETLEAGKPFHIADIGCLTINPRLERGGKKWRAAITFQTSKSFRQRLKLPEDNGAAPRQAGICKTCGRRPGKTRIYDECDPCMHARARRSRPRTRTTDTPTRTSTKERER